MIQRKQTIFLLLAVIAMVVCLCLPIGTFEPATMTQATRWFNIGFMSAGQPVAWHPVPFVILAVTVILSLVDIFRYNHRVSQARWCLWSMLIIIVWYVYAGLGAFLIFSDKGSFHVGWASCLPLVALILLLLARQGILADEKLVRSMDRIR
ncbi:putative uncharacterized protein [Prevotella sp. CAG:924]|nr:putative uncharacterized protein [Prevotella sp. CAG:924]